MGFLDNLINRFATPNEERSSMSAALLPANRATQGSNISVAEALTLPAVYRAVSILTTTVKQMSLDVVRDDRVVGTPTIIEQPNPMTSRATFIEQTMVSLATNGNAYWRIDRDSNKRVVALTPLNPLDVYIESDVNGKVISYRYLNENYDPSRIKHLPLLQVPGSNLGLGPIQAASQSLQGTAQLRDYATQWFEKGGVPSGVLKTDQFISDEQVAAAKEAWNATAGAKNGVAILGNNWSYMPVYLKPEELQFIANQNFSVTEVARIFGVPSTLMLTAVDGSSMVYSNVEQEWLAFIRFTIMQYLLVIENALSDFTVGRQKVKFNIEAILRGATKDRYESYKLGIDAGWLTKNEVRTIEDLPTIPGLDEMHGTVQNQPQVAVDPNLQDPNHIGDTQHINDVNPQGGTNV